VVRKTAATFAPRASSAKQKNPAQPGTKLYSIFETQAYFSMLFGGILSFNLLFPSDHPDIWRLMGMWSVWMFSKFCNPISFSRFPFFLNSMEFFPQGFCWNSLVQLRIVVLHDLRNFWLQVRPNVHVMVCN
jgi:hypothetical protein